MRSNLLRRDEIWLADKVGGQSELTRMSDFADIGVRKDADLLASLDAARSKGRRSRAHREPGYGQALKAASGSSYPGTGPLPSSSELRREAQRTAEISARTTSPEEDVERARALLKRVTSTFSEPDEELQGLVAKK